MPFGESFQSTIKSNKSIMLDKSRRFRKTLGGFDWSKSPRLNLPESTPEQLENIRLRTQQDNRNTVLKEFTLTLLLTPLLVSAIVYIIV
ncbi:hypothetical protein FPF71_11310 [Algibacter amylolyticus]|uniref:Uncharacterized protein n=1 Tax=Algibacter amylolyticus TaxID=1608400 RepID=A0A5M7B3R6_9FLAO|nr:hypothetical protein [Algibacter amylolyticus]KAA5824193.1 hypothetical protein F2B50_11310 [Algibacter amylolyticus]MBB5269753.1 hypothetical protein [Algibacter amylolyticus]TSJ74670.1 hypothetical protein FPF71_11310 [Algibacter amylolyticus]